MILGTSRYTRLPNTRNIKECRVHHAWQKQTKSAGCITPGRNNLSSSLNDEKFFERVSESYKPEMSAVNFQGTRDSSASPASSYLLEERRGDNSETEVAGRTTVVPHHGSTEISCSENVLNLA